MKNINFIIYFLILPVTQIFGQNIKTQTVKTEINAVTIYLNGAEIKRNKTVSLKPGKTTLVFTELSPKLKPKSIRIKTDTDIDLLGITAKKNYLTKETNRPKVKNLKDSLKIITERIQEIKDILDAYSVEKKMLLSNISIGGEDNGVSINELKTASDFYRKRIIEINTGTSKLKKEKQKLSISIQKINKQLNELNANSGYYRFEITVLVSTEKQTSGNIEIKYLTDAAGWSPSYDIKALDTNKPVKLEYRAKVFNNTGIDWKNIKIKLSTADPNLSVSKPVLKPWYLKYKTYNYNAYKNFKKAQGYIQNQAVIVQAEGVSQDNVKFEEIDEEDADLDFNNNNTNNILYSETEVPELSAEFNIKKTYDIPSDNKPYIVDIDEFSLDASYKHFAVTKLDKDVFLLARITGWQDLNLIEGPANIYYAGTYLGQSFINIRNVKDTLDLSLGRDGKVLVTRTKLKEYNSSKIIGNKKKETFSYEIVAKNNRKTSIKLQIQDQIPVSQTDEIEVKIPEISGANYEEPTGKLTWELNLKPGETKKINLSFEIKYPKNKQIETEKRKAQKIRYF